MTNKRRIEWCSTSEADSRIYYQDFVTVTTVEHFGARTGAVILRAIAMATNRFNAAFAAIASAKT